MNSANPPELRPTGMQAMMAYWERLHAVNAVQIAELSCSLSPQRLQLAVNRLFGKFRAADSLGRWSAISKTDEVRREEVSARIHPMPANSEVPLDSLVTDLLNEPFSEGEPPFRVRFVEGDEKHYLLLSYRHSISDARSIALLMQNLLEELLWDGSGDLPLLVNREVRSIADLFPREARRASALQSIGSSIKTLWNLQSCHCRPPTDANAFRMSFLIHEEQLSLASLQQRARDCGATVGELVLAAMLEWFLDQDRLLGCSRWSENRCVSVLVDLTARSEVKQPLLFGQYLSPLNVIANFRRHASFEDLLCQVRAISRSYDAVTEGLRSLRGLSVNEFLIRRLPRPVTHWHQGFFFPVSGALSNVNLRSTLPPPRMPLPVVNYFRGTCATQWSPMILCLTTVHETCTLTTTHRDAVYTAEEMHGLARHVVQRAFGDESAAYG